MENNSLHKLGIDIGSTTVKIALLDEENNIIGYQYVNLGKMMDGIKAGDDPAEAVKKASGEYGRFSEAVKTIDPRRE